MHQVMAESRDDDTYGIPDLLWEQIEPLLPLAPCTIRNSVQLVIKGRLDMRSRRAVPRVRQHLIWLLACLTLYGLLLPVSAASGAVNSPPEVTNVSAIADIDNALIHFSYDLRDTEQDAVQVTLRVSEDGGQTYTVPVDSAEGDVGYPVTPGVGKGIIWHYDLDAANFPRISADGFRARIIADDLHEVDIQELVDQVNSLNLANDLAFVQGIRHRITGLAHLEAAKDFIEERFRSSGLQASRHEFLFEGYSAANIIGRLPGQTQEEITYIIDAHFDTVPDSPGADDNGSGVAGMLEAMRVLSAYNFAHTIKFIGFDLEEMWCEGSRRYVNYDIPKYEQIAGVFNFEMIGYSCSQPDCQESMLLQLNITGYGPSGDFILAIANEDSLPIKAAYEAHAAMFVPELRIASAVVPRDKQDAFWGSDHSIFWHDGYQALTLSDTGSYRNPNYHTPDDTSDTLDFDFMASVVKATVATVAKLADVRHSSAGIVSTLRAVEPAGKQPVTWGQIKSMADYQISR